MFNWLRRLDPEASGLARMTRQFGQMLDDGRHAFDAASNAFLGGSDPEVIKDDLFRTDANINHLERQIRRDIVVHGSVHGPSELPACLVLMSIVKDAERIGDYAKNLFDLAVMTQLVKDDKYYQDLCRLKDKISSVLGEARRVYGSQNADKARSLVQSCDELMDWCDEKVDALLEPGVSVRQPVASALAYRYFKRVLGHTSNIVSSIIMPVDQLDYVDETKEASSQ